MNIIVPIDYSSVSIHAAKYAVALSKQYADVHYIFYYAHYTDADIVTFEDQMKELVAEMKLIQPNLSYTTVVERRGIVEGIHALEEEHNADLIVMGIHGKGKLQQKLIGSNTLLVAEKANAPVLILSEKAAIQKADSLLLAVPYRPNVHESLPVEAIAKTVSTFQLRFEVASVYENQRVDSLIGTLKDQEKLLHVWKDLNPEYKTLGGENIVQALLDYAHEEKSSWLCTIAEPHGFWEILLKGSITSDLAYQSDVPILVF